MKYLIYLLLITLLISCASPFDKKYDIRLYVKEIDSPPVHLNWFFYSLISNFSQDFITIENNSQEDTVCVADNIADLQLSGDSIKIGFYGYPRKYVENTIIPTKVGNYKIIADTSFTRTWSPYARKIYKKNEE